MVCHESESGLGRSVGRLALAVVSGAVIAWVVTAFVLDALFAAGGYTPEAIVELPRWAFGLVTAAGALSGAIAALLAGRVLLPRWVRAAALGSLIGGGGVVLATLVIAAVLGGPSSKLQAPYLVAGLAFGVPAGFLIGGVGGLLVSKRCRA